MAFFKAKTGWQRPRKREKKILVPITSYLTRNRKLIKLAIKLKKLKNIFMAFFEAKMGWERPRKREKKNYRSDQFLPYQEQKVKKKQQKNSKN